MLKYIVRRLIGAIPVLFGLSIVLFAFVHLLPGDPATAILGQHATADRVQAMREYLHLNDPLWQQYLAYVGNILRGDFGSSVINNQPILREFIVRFPATIELTVAAIIAIDPGHRISGDASRLRLLRSPSVQTKRESRAPSPASTPSALDAADATRIQQSTRARRRTARHTATRAAMRSRG